MTGTNKIELPASSLVTTDWLASNLDAPGLVVLDGTFTLPGATPDAAELYRTAHIPGAIFFDIDAVAASGGDLPHMLPSPAEFERMVGALGISETTPIVVYDGPGLMSAGRVWWTFRAFGHDAIRVLDGGLKKWRAEGRAVESDRHALPAARYSGATAPATVRDKADILANIDSAAEQVIDARSAARFTAEEKEARPGLRSGHMPGALNLPFNALSDPETGELRPPAELKALFENAGLDLDKPVVTTCGSGVTACALVFALHVLGKDDVAVYDGSWVEWGSDPDVPILT